MTIVSYKDEHFVCLLLEIAYCELMRMNLLKFTTAAIGRQLGETG